MNEQSVTVSIEADTSAFKAALDDLSDQSKRFGATFTSALKGAIVSGKSFEDTIKSIGLRMASTALSAGLKPLEGLASNFFQQALSGLGSGIGNILPFANGGVVSSQGVVPFASGGVVASPTFFQAGKRLGVMGEAGAEAILPLARGADGKLGVRTGSAGGGATNITFNIATRDADSFRKSEAQVTAMLARAVGRGRRSL